MSSSDSIPAFLAILFGLPALLGIIWPYPGPKGNRQHRRLIVSIVISALAIVLFSLTDLLQLHGQCQMEGAPPASPNWWVILDSRCDEQNAVLLALGSLIFVPVMVLIYLAAGYVRKGLTRSSD